MREERSLKMGWRFGSKLRFYTGVYARDGTSGQILLISMITILVFIRLSFYIITLPLWEGFDEWAHFSYVDHITRYNKVPERSSVPSQDIIRSLALAPLSPIVKEELSNTISHIEYWRLSGAERQRRQAKLKDTNYVEAEISVFNYEAQQPPLAYWILSGIDRVLASRTIIDRVFAFRFFDIFLAALVIPVLWICCRCSLRDISIGPIVCTSVALAPGFAIFVGRVSNDAAATLLISVSLVFYLKRQGTMNTVTCAFLTAASLLTKSYSIILLLCFLYTRMPFKFGLLSIKRYTVQFLIFCTILVAIVGWWYVPVLWSTHTISGEQIDIVASRTSLMERIKYIWDMSWWRVVMMASDTHIWVGSWSFLIAKPWMYWFFRCFGIFSVLGWLREFLRKRALRGNTAKLALRPLGAKVLIPAFCLFLIATGYHAVQIFAVTGKSAALGWYLYAFVVPESIIIIGGLVVLVDDGGRRLLARILCVALGIFDLYTMHFIRLPYYAGLTPVDEFGQPRMFSWRQWPDGGLHEVLGRLAINKIEILDSNVLLVWWIAYLVATITLIILSASSRFHANLSISTGSSKSPSVPYAK